MILGGGVTGPDVFMEFMSILVFNYYYLLSLFIFCIYAMALFIAFTLLYIGYFGTGMILMQIELFLSRLTY